MEQISINLALEEVNTILDALGQLPYSEVFQLVHKVKAQAEAQVEANEIRGQQHELENRPTIKNRGY